jgi:hypothetical protein
VPERRFSSKSGNVAGKQQSRLSNECRSPIHLSRMRRSTQVPSRTLYLVVAVVLGSLGRTAVVHAFSQPSYYARRASDGGGGGLWFSGSPADGYACDVCHTGRDNAWPIHVEGLPLKGYVPGARYDVKIRWPEFSARAASIKASEPAVPSTGEPGQAQSAGPDMSLVAELTTLTGQGAGVFEMNYTDIADSARKDEWCEHLEGVPASQLFDTHSAMQDTPVLRCDPSQPGQRCLVTVQVCGARMLRFTWTAPSAQAGQLWFAAGLVATERLSAEPTGDDVSLALQPIFPASSGAARYVSEVDHGCGVTGHGLDSRPSLAVWVLAGLWLATHKQRTSRRPFEEKA